MIIVNVKGGLGNQLFQYALGRVLAIKNSDVLKLDIDFYRDKGREYERKFLLNQFNIPELIATDQEIMRVKKSLGVNWKIKSWLSKYVFKNHLIIYVKKITKKLMVKKYKFVLQRTRTTCGLVDLNLD